MNQWQPQPGTIPALAIDHLRKLRAQNPPRIWISSAELAEAIGHDSRGFGGFMKMALEQGAVIKHKATRSNHVFWRLPEPAGNPNGRMVAMVEKLARMPASSEVVSLTNIEPASDWLAPPAAPQPAPPRIRAGSAPAVWGLLDDGLLHIEKAGKRVALEPFEFESLLAFLNRTCGTEVPS